MRNIILTILFFTSLSSTAQSLEKERVLYGVITKDSLQKEPYAKWFVNNYKGYAPDSNIINNFQKQNLKGITIKAFFGSWCGDSKRELPRFLKLLSAISFPEKNVQLIGLGSSDSLYKQSPTQEEAGLGIYRVPTFIFYKNGIEINRINEFPVSSLEKDMFSIVSYESYLPNYKSFAVIHKWMREGILTDNNISARSLAEQIRLLVSNENELNSLGYLLLKHGNKKEGLKIFQINYNLYPTSSNITSSLGEGYLENGDYKRAINTLEYALEINKEPNAIKPILELLYKAKEKEKI